MKTAPLWTSTLTDVGGLFSSVGIKVNQSIFLLVRDIAICYSNYSCYTVASSHRSQHFLQSWRLG